MAFISLIEILCNYFVQHFPFIVVLIVLVKKVTYETHHQPELDLILILFITVYKHILLVFLNHSKKSSYTLFQMFLQVDIFNSLKKGLYLEKTIKDFT